MQSDSAEFKVDLTNCDKEPIHIPGKIQPHGFLLVVNKFTWKIVQVSANTAAFIGHNAEALLGKGVDQIIGDENLKVVKDWDENYEGHPVNLLTVNLPSEQGDRQFNMIYHLSGRHLVFEFEPLEASMLSSLVNFYHYQNKVIGKYQQCKSLEELCQVTAEEVKTMTGYDRVMMYRFDEAYNGKVISEVKEPHISPFLGHHFPASDIPKQARELYLKNWVRILPDRDYRPVPLVPELNPQTDKPVDLSLSTLRSVSPIHIEYLKNMGVQATLVISIIKDEKLWGLISCHHYAPKFVDYHLRASCEFLGKIFSYHLSLLQETEDEDYARKAWDIFYKLKEQMSGKDISLSLTRHYESGQFSESVFRALTKNEVSVLNLNDCHGAAIFYEGKLDLLGATPDKGFVGVLLNWLPNVVDENGLYATSQLSADLPEAEQHADRLAGLLAVAINQHAGEFILWFKPEVIETVEWAGNPNKPVLMDGEDMRLTPRKSFDKWSVEVHAKSKPWKAVDIEVALQLRETLRDKLIEQKQELADLNEELEKMVENRTWELTEALYKQQELNEELSITEEELKVNLDQMLLRNEEIRQYSEELTRMLKEMPVAVSYVDEEGKISKVNPAFCQLYGYEEEELIGQPFTMLYPHYDHAQLNKLKSDYQLLLKIDRRQHGAISIRTKSGQDKIVIVDRKQLQNAEGKNFMVNYFQDVTSLKKTEKSLQQATRFIETVNLMAPVILFVHRFQFNKITNINSRVQTLLDYTKEELTEMPGGFLALVAENQKQALEDILRRLQEKTEQELSGKFAFRHKQGDYHEFKAVFRALKYDEQGNVEEVLGMLLPV